MIFFLIQKKGERKNFCLKYFEKNSRKGCFFVSAKCFCRFSGENTAVAKEQLKKIFN